MKHFLLLGATLVALGVGANAQQNDRGNRGNNQNNNGGGVLPLPEGVEKVVSIDAFNILIAQSNREGKSELSPIIVRHIYSGGVARLFGGETVPTAQFVSPGAFGGNRGNGGGQGNNSQGNGGGQNGGFGGQLGGFGGGSGGQNGGFGGGFQNGGGFGGVGNGGGVSNGGNLGGGFGGAFQMRRFGRGN